MKKTEVNSKDLEFEDIPLYAEEDDGANAVGLDKGLDKDFHARIETLVSLESFDLPESFPMGLSFEALLEAMDRIRARYKEEVPALQRDDLSKEAKQKIWYNILESRGWLRACVTDDLRCVFVRMHARNFSTRRIIDHIFGGASYERAFDAVCKEYQCALHPWFVFVDLCGLENIAAYLLPRLSYLRMQNSRFPEKYNAVWNEARTGYLAEVRQIPLATEGEQLGELTDMYRKLKYVFDQSSDDPSAMARLSTSMIRILGAIHMLTKK